MNVFILKALILDLFLEFFMVLRWLLWYQLKHYYPLKETSFLDDFKSQGKKENS